LLLLVSAGGRGFSGQLVENRASACCGGPPAAIRPSAGTCRALARHDIYRNFMTCGAANSGHNREDFMFCEDFLALSHPKVFSDMG
jgi:hypothetical protein